MQIQENISLKRHNSFGIESTAAYFSAFQDADELAELLDWAVKQTSDPVFVLGGGSNILLTKDIPGLVIKNEVKGFEVIGENDDHVIIAVGAGENWHGTVMRCIANNWAGIENLALIPGNTGASPMQNIGAYGVEIKDVFYQLEAWDRQDRKMVSFKPADCEFGYRESVFKNKLKDRFIIVKVCFRLNKKPEYHISYGAIREELEQEGVQELSIRAVAEAVIRIRSSKLPDPAKIGNAGSFFKNPEIDQQQYDLLKKEFPGIVGYPLPAGSVKLAAGWLIEKAGWKGYREGDAGCHERQALVLVNHGSAKGSEILALAEKISASVFGLFGVQLQKEVNII